MTARCSHHLPLPPGARLVMATDGHVVSPLFFPGGDIGCLSVHGTVNDVAMSGATPLYLTASFILEEGFPLADLKRIVDSMALAARRGRRAGHHRRHQGGRARQGRRRVHQHHRPGRGGAGRGHRRRAMPGRGDVMLLSGTIGDHGVAVLSKRESLEFETTIESDTAALHTLVAAMLQAAPGGVRVLRDPTRGGLATTLNEIARQSGVGMMLEEAAIPVLPQVDAACELLGLDPLYVANEGKLIAICAPEAAEAVLAAMRAHPQGRAAARIGVVTEDAHHFVQMNTRFGGRRVVDWLSGEQLPRIC